MTESTKRNLKIFEEYYWLADRKKVLEDIRKENGKL